MLNSEFPPLGGGAGHATAELLRQFARQSNLQIDLITASSGARRELTIGQSIRIYCLDIGKSESNLQTQSNRDLIRYALAARRLARQLNAEQGYDLVHAFFTVPAGYIARQLGKPYIVSVRGTDVPGHNSKYRLAYLCLSPMIRNVIRRARFVVANSDDLKGEAETFYRRPYQVIPNGVDLDFFAANKQPKRGFRVLAAGRLHAVKQLDVLLAAWAEFIKEAAADDACLIIAGDGPERLSLQRLAGRLGISHRVRWLGQLNRERLRDEYQRCSAYVQISEKEGMSNTLLEAMACGAPVIATDTGGARQLVDRSNGGIVRSGQVSEARQMLVDLYRQSEQQRVEMGRHSRLKAERFTWERTADAYLRLYQQTRELA